MGTNFGEFTAKTHLVKQALANLNVYVMLFSIEQSNLAEETLVNLCTWPFANVFHLQNSSIWYILFNQIIASITGLLIRVIDFISF